MKRFTKATAILLCVLLTLTSMPFAVFAADKTFTVSSEEELSAAVNEINSAAETGEYTISLAGDIACTGISFSNSKTTVTIIGNGHYITKTGGDTLVVSVSNGAVLNLGSEDDNSTLTLIGINGDEAPGILFVDNGSTANMYDGVTIRDGKSNNYLGGGVTVNNNSKFNMFGGTIDNCAVINGSVCYGGGIAAYCNSTVIMYDGVISNCTAETNYTTWQQDGLTEPALGGGVYVGGCSAFVMAGGEIKNCSAGRRGGAIAVQMFNSQGTLDSIFQMLDGVIDGCEAGYSGGGIAVIGSFYDNANPIGTSPRWPNVLSNGTALIAGGEIKNCYAGFGGGIYLTQLCRNVNKEISISDCTITGNEATKGAGIYVDSYWTKTVVDNCTITDNVAYTYGGGIGLNNNGSGGYLTLSNSTISNNLCAAIQAGFGGGVYYDTNSTVKLSGANTIQDNRIEDETGILNNLNVLSKSNPVKVIGDLTGSDIGVTDYVLRDDGLSDSDDSAVSADFLTSGYKTYNTADPASYFSSDHQTWVPAFSETPNTNEVRLIRRTQAPQNEVYLTTKDSVDINFIIDADSYTSDPEAYFKLNYNHNPKTYTQDFRDEQINVSDVQQTSDGRYAFTIDSAPAQLTESIKIALYDSNDTKLYDVDYSMWRYCKDIMDKYISIEQDTSATDIDEEKWEKANELCKSLIDYATAAQIYFDYNTEDMASKTVPTDVATYFEGSADKELYYHDVPSVQANDVLNNGNAVASISGDGSFPITHTSLMSLSNTEVRFYYEEELNPSDYSLELNCSGWYGTGAHSARFGSANSGTFIEVTGVESANLDNVFTLTITENSTGKKTIITYNALAYCYTVLRDTEGTSDVKEAQLRTLVKSVYLYNQYAEEYFSSLNA